MFSIRAFILLSIIIFSSAIAEAIPVDLTPFDQSAPSSTVVSGSSASLYEDALFESLTGDTILATDSLFIPSDAQSLSFGYQFTEPIGFEDNYFSAYLFDPVTNLYLQNSVGDEFYVNFGDPNTNPELHSGSILWNFSGTSLPGSTVGLQFVLAWGNLDWDFNANVEISNVEINTTAVPEPSSLALIVAGLMSIIILRKCSFVRRYV